MLFKAIVVEGLDGTGKDTIVENIVSKYSNTDIIPVVLNVSNNRDLDNITEFINKYLPISDGVIYKYNIQVAKQQVINGLEDVALYHNHPNDIEENKNTLIDIFSNIVDNKFKQINTLLEIIDLIDEKVLFIINRYVSSTYVYYPIDVLSKSCNKDDYYIDCKDIIKYSMDFLIENNIKFVYISTDDSSRSKMIGKRNVANIIEKTYDELSLSKKSNLLSNKYNYYIDELSHLDKEKINCLVVENHFSDDFTINIEKITNEIINFI